MLDVRRRADDDPEATAWGREPLRCDAVEAQRDRDRELGRRAVKERAGAWIGRQDVPPVTTCVQPARRRPLAVPRENLRTVDPIRAVEGSRRRDVGLVGDVDRHGLLVQRVRPSEIRMGRPHRRPRPWRSGCRGGERGGGEDRRTYERGEEESPPTRGHESKYRVEMPPRQCPKSEPIHGDRPAQLGNRCH